MPPQLHNTACFRIDCKCISSLNRPFKMFLTSNHVQCISLEFLLIIQDSYSTCSYLHTQSEIETAAPTYFKKQFHQNNFVHYCIDKVVKVTDHDMLAMSLSFSREKLHAVFTLTGLTTFETLLPTGPETRPGGGWGCPEKILDCRV